MAEKNKLTSLADLSRYLQEGGTFKLAASAEFIERADALPAFEKAYGTVPHATPYRPALNAGPQITPSGFFSLIIPRTVSVAVSTFSLK